ncbi:DUF1501 domain-containing protein [Xanthobacter agilis]|jgi:uncharacterized protein (DUF1501 family)|uniref:Uncharacterized protein (DUF1501 family) n=1 Tax=Xanthobacter agilis TaxID=47492 RepID=A0ABU0LJ82_XANAG|nr:DUF1501 domain-containing protein [Xanthobacter agilis]MDQ0507203.1 uncharacterized protein (DUF1501 family) [Xanthobacter agilis]
MPAGGLTRRAFMAAAGATALSAPLVSWPYVPRAWGASGRDPRLLVVVLRGGLDGLATVMPVGDPDFAALRNDFRNPKLAEAPSLDSLFVLNPALRHLSALYTRKELLLFQAVATPYRARSHFDAQAMLESGLPDYGITAESGWLNRALQKTEAGPRLKKAPGLVVAPTAPLIMRGAAPVESWQPQAFSYVDDDTLQRLMQLYEARDPELARALSEGADVDMKLHGVQKVGNKAQAADSVQGFPEAMKTTGLLMAAADGPRIGAINFNGWDTHALEGAYDGRLAKTLQALDHGFAALETSLGPVWSDTAVLVITEFGRTARVNGSLGTDHGTGTIAMLLGGAVSGGRVIADWPGLSQKVLFEGRDLAPTLDIRAVMKGLLREHLDLSPAVLATEVFPDSSAIVPLRGLVRT